MKSNAKRQLKVRDIAITDDGTFFKDFHKPNRRVAVMYVKQDKMSVSRLKSLKGKEKQVSRGMLVPLKDKYKCLPRPTGSDIRFISRDKNGQKLRTGDKRFKPTGEELTERDYSRIINQRRKLFKK